MKRPFLFVVFILGLAGVKVVGAQGPSPSSLPPPAATQPSPESQPSASPHPGWQLVKEKQYPLYKVQTFLKENRAMPLGIEGTKAVITNARGKVVAEVKNLLIEPDPRETIFGAAPGAPLDLDKDGFEDLVIRVFTGGAHCCYSYQIFSLGKVFKKIADLKLNDCGERIKLQDLNGDGLSEIVTCNAAFTYLKDIPYSQSPFPPQVFGLENGKFANQDKKYPQVFQDDIASQKKQIQEKGSTVGDVLQIVVDYFMIGKEAEGWAQFDQGITASPKKESLRQDLKERWQKFLGVAPSTRPAETTPASNPAERSLP